MYAKIEPTGCSVRRGAVQLRIDLFLEPFEPRYAEHYVQAVDEGSKAFKNGYKGRMKDGEPVDPDDYNKWLNGLPKKWQNNPFHSHFIQMSPDATDEEIQRQIKTVLDTIGDEHTKHGDVIQAARRVSTHYRPFDVVAKEEKKVTDELREKGSSGLVDSDTCLLLTRSALRGLQIASNKDSFMVVK